MKIDMSFLEERPLSYSSLKEFAKSPKHYVNYVLAKREPSKEMNFGSLIHCLLLYPDKLNEQFAVMPSVDRRTKEGKDIYNKFVEDSNGKICVGQDELDEANSIVDSVMTTTAAKSYIEQCYEFEKEFRSTVGGLPFRGFVDGISDNFILEVKTASDGSPESIIRDFFNRKYYLQAGLYNIVHNLPVVYLVIETKAPYNSLISKATDRYIDQGKNEISSLIDKFKYCMDVTGFNQGYEAMLDKEFSIDLPLWIK